MNSSPRLGWSASLLLAAIWACLQLCALPAVAEDDVAEVTTVVTPEPVRMVDGENRFKRHVVLRHTGLTFQSWIDDRYVLAATARTYYKGPAGPGELPRDSWVKLDTETGAFEVLPWKVNSEEFSEVSCFDVASGRVIVRQRLLVAPKRWDVRWMGGVLGQPLKEIWYDTDPGPNGKRREPTFGKGNIQANCEIVPKLVHRLTEVGGAVTYLRDKRGWLFTLAGYSSHGGPRHVYLIQPDGKEIRIPITEGEVMDRGYRYVTYRDAYFGVPTLIYRNPDQIWSPHFARLVHTDGKVEQFPVPKLIMDGVTGKQWSASALYTRSGLLWHVNPRVRKPGGEFIDGFYLVLGDELVRVAQNIKGVSPDGCKLFGYSDLTGQKFLNPLLSTGEDYFIVDLCREIT